jgi:hypothetical protein
MSKIPSEEDFTQAKALARHRWRAIDEISMSILDRFRVLGPLHKVYVIPEGEDDFRVYIVFETEAQLKSGYECGLFDAIEEFVYQELERFGRGTREAVSVAMEFDSHEKVLRVHGGDYSQRLR